MNNKIKLTVAMPSFNEEKVITKMIEEIRRHTENYDTEIVLVDSSKDRTADIAEEMGARVIRQKPQGHGIALRTAINAAKGDIIITADCDNTYPMEYIPRLLELIAQGNDIISGNRFSKNLKEEMPFFNKMANRSFAFLVRLLYKVNVHDVSTGMFCMKREVNEKIVWENNYSFPCEVIIRSNLEGFKHKEIEIPYRMRIGEVTLHKWRSGKAYLRCIFKYRFNLKIDPKLL